MAVEVKDGELPVVVGIPLEEKEDLENKEVQDGERRDKESEDKKPEKKKATKKSKKREFLEITISERFELNQMLRNSESIAERLPKIDKKYIQGMEEEFKADDLEKTTIKYERGTYTGQVKEGTKIRHGYGTMRSNTGNEYKGYWRNGQGSGFGTYQSNFGQVYEGEFEGDKRNGIGVYYWPNGDKYEGEWKDDVMDGLGIYWYKKSGNRHEGNWKRDWKEGVGVVYDESDNILQAGVWRLNKFQD